MIHEESSAEQMACLTFPEGRFIEQRTFLDVCTVLKKLDRFWVVHPDEMKALGAWGFDVFDNRTSPPEEEDQTPEKV